MSPGRDYLNDDADSRSLLRVRGSSSLPSTLPTFSPTASSSPSPFGQSHKRHTMKSPRNQDLITRRRLIGSLVSLAVAAFLLVRLASDLVAMTRYKLRDRAFEEGWLGGCGMRKPPLAFVQGDGRLALVWETNCEQAFSLSWDALTMAEMAVEEARRSSKGWSKKKVEVGSTGDVGKVLTQTAIVKGEQLMDGTSTRWVYRSAIVGLVGGKNYVYEIRYAVDDLSRGPSSILVANAVLERQIFPFLGPTPSIPTPTTIHIASLADNQFNLRIFHRVLESLQKYTKSLPPVLSAFSPSSSTTLPALIIHAGDHVQNPYNLKQWQTDFWDPVSALIRDQFKRTIPILLSRGNHDWDASGKNAYTGGRLPREDWIAAQLENKTQTTTTTKTGESIQSYEGGTNARGMYMSYSPHTRCRILVLDSNVDVMEELEQERWLTWELERDEWKWASLRIVVVHVPPFLEYWDQTTWVDGGESKWSTFVRTRLTPLLSYHGASLVLSGHSHAYSRGFLPSYLHSTFASTANSSTLPKSTRETAANYAYMPHYDHDLRQRVVENGTVYTVLGGAGGSLDGDRVEDWKFYEKSDNTKHFFGWMTLTFGDEEIPRRKDEERVYRLEGRDCQGQKREVLDRLEWKAIEMGGKVLDTFRIEIQGCD